MLLALPKILAVIVGVIVLMRGGRYERLVVGFMVARGAIQVAEALTWWPHHRPAGAHYYVLASFPQAALLAGLAWLVSRHRARWLKLMVVFQALHVAADMAMIFHPDLSGILTPVIHALSLAKTACLAWALVLRSAGPPAPVPGQAAFDAYRADAARRGGAKD
ncbi:MAG: hypothetical protein JWP35_605 [Caulobacter sp.]|nr:hypothetical protein [Caulobacter sp.]